MFGSYSDEHPKCMSGKLYYVNIMIIAHALLHPRFTCSLTDLTSFDQTIFNCT